MCQPPWRARSSSRRAGSREADAEATVWLALMVPMPSMAARLAGWAARMASGVPKVFEESFDEDGADAGEAGEAKECELRFSAPTRGMIRILVGQANAPAGGRGRLSSLNFGNDAT